MIRILKKLFRVRKKTPPCEHARLALYYNVRHSWGRVTHDNPMLYQHDLWIHVFCPCCSTTKLVGERALTYHARDKDSVTSKIWAVDKAGSLVPECKLDFEDSWFSDDIQLCYRKDNSSDMIASILSPNVKFISVKLSRIDLRKFLDAEIKAGEGFSNYTLADIAAQSPTKILT